MCSRVTQEPVQGGLLLPTCQSHPRPCIYHLTQQQCCQNKEPLSCSRTKQPGRAFLQAGSGVHVAASSYLREFTACDKHFSWNDLQKLHIKGGWSKQPLAVADCIFKLNVRLSIQMLACRRPSPHIRVSVLGYASPLQYTLYHHDKLCRDLVL